MDKRKNALKQRPKMGVWKKAILMLPVLISVSWIVYLQYNKYTYSYYGMELLSPLNTAPLMIALVIFTVGYIIFLLLMFSENIQDFIWRRLGH